MLKMKELIPVQEGKMFQSREWEELMYYRVKVPLLLIDKLTWYNLNLKTKISKLRNTLKNKQKGLMHSGNNQLIATLQNLYHK